MDWWNDKRLAKGFAQEYGIDYKEIFAFVARITSVRSLLVVVVVHWWQLLQMNVKNAFMVSKSATFVILFMISSKLHVCSLSNSVLWSLNKVLFPTIIILHGFYGQLMQVLLSSFYTLVTWLSLEMTSLGYEIFKKF